MSSGIKRAGDLLTGWEFMRSLHKTCCFQSRERVGLASNSELKRWLQDKAVLVNGEPLGWDEDMDFPIFSLVLFPKGRRVTLL